MAALNSLPAKAPDAVKKEYAELIKSANTWATQLGKYADAVEATDHSKYDQKKKEMDKAKDDVNDAVDLANQIKGNYFDHPEALEKLAQKVADKADDLVVKLTKLTTAASAASGLKPPDKIP